MIRAVIFDLDGTLVDSLPGIADGLNRALAANGLPTHPNDLVRTFIGSGSWMLAKRGIGGEPEDSRVDKIHEAFLVAYDETWRAGTTLYPGIRELLAELHQDGVILALLSNKPHRFTVAIMDSLFDFVPFASVLGQREGIPRKPDPTGALMVASELALEPKEIAYVGDSTIDFATAQAAGMQPFLVSWGFHTAAQLSATAAPLFSSAEELRECLKSLHPGG